MSKKFKSHTVENISFSGPMIHFRMDGQEHAVDLLKHSYRLGVAAQEQREHVGVTDDGIALYWPDLDEGILLDVLIGKVKMLPGEVHAAWEAYVSQQGNRVEACGI